MECASWQHCLSPSTQRKEATAKRDAFLPSFLSYQREAKIERTLEEKRRGEGVEQGCQVEYFGYTRVDSMLESLLLHIYVLPTPKEGSSSNNKMKKTFPMIKAGLHFSLGFIHCCSHVFRCGRTTPRSGNPGLEGGTARKARQSAHTQVHF